MFQVGDLVRFRNSAIRKHPPGPLCIKRVKGRRLKYARRKQRISRVTAIVHQNYDPVWRRYRVMVLLDDPDLGRAVDAVHLVLHRRDPDWMMREMQHDRFRGRFQEPQLTSGYQYRRIQTSRPYFVISTDDTF